MSDQYYRFFPGDYLRDTQGLTLTENGAYRMLLDAYYSQEYLIDDRQELYMICRAFKEFEQRAVDKVVEKYFSKNGNGKLINHRAEEEITHRKEFIAEQSRKGKISAEKRWPKDNHGLTTVRVRLQPNDNLPSPSPSPSPLPKEKRKNTVCVLPEFLSKETWELFLAHRRAVKAPVVKGAEKTFITKFEKLREKGWDSRVVVETMVEKGWRWFKPEWVEPKKGISDSLFGTCKKCHRPNIELIRQGLCAECTRSVPWT